MRIPHNAHYVTLQIDDPPRHARPHPGGPDAGKRPAMTPETTPEWTSYYEAVDGRAPRELLIEALDALGDVGSAIDLGCGDGTETAELLRRGWRVLAIDAEADGIRRLRRRVPVADAARLEARVGR